MKHGPVLGHQIIPLTGRRALQAELPEIRRVECRGAEMGKVYFFLTNHRRWSAQTVNALRQNAFTYFASTEVR